MQLKKDTLIDVSGISDQEFRHLQARLIIAGLSCPLSAFPVYADGSRIKPNLVSVSPNGYLCFQSQAQNGQKIVHYKEYVAI